MAIVIPLIGTPTGIAEVRPTPAGIDEVREPSPVIITGDPRLAVTVVVWAEVVFFFGRVDGSAWSLRLDGLLLTPEGPAVIRSETFFTAKHRGRVS